jgi:hypothetical protein
MRIGFALPALDTVEMPAGKTCYGIFPDINGRALTSNLFKCRADLANMQLVMLDHELHQLL